MDLPVLLPPDPRAVRLLAEQRDRPEEVRRLIWVQGLVDAEQALHLRIQETRIGSAFGDFGGMLKRSHVCTKGLVWSIIS